MKKQYFLTVDVESTMQDMAADYAAVISDKQGNVITQCAVLVKGVFGEQDLFYDKTATNIWAKSNLAKRQEAYEKMLNEGIRQLASVNAINKWLEKANAQFNPILTAYNLPFDARIMNNSGIKHSIFTNRFCLWQMAIGHYANTKNYKEFILKNHLFNNVTTKQNCTYKTNAEVMASFLSGYMLPDEPHTALEDIIDYELPILNSIIKRRNWREKEKPYNWRDYQVKSHFTAI